METVKPKISWDLPDGWELIQRPKLVPVVGVNNGWLVFYRRRLTGLIGMSSRGESILTLLVGEYSGQVINWCYTP